jgi:hypothetical protein
MWVVEWRAYVYVYYDAKPARHKGSEHVATKNILDPNHCEQETQQTHFNNTAILQGLSIIHTLLI